MCIYCRNDRWFDDKIQGNPIFGGEREEGMGWGEMQKKKCTRQIKKGGYLVHLEDMNSSDGLGTSTIPSGDIKNTPTSAVEPNLVRGK